MFETETMAELCVGQKLMDQAIAIYRRLVVEAPDEITAERRRRRLAELQRQTAAAPAATPKATPTPAAATAPTGAGPSSELPLPGIKASWDRRHAVLQWRLADDTEAPALELLLVMRTAAGIITERRTLRLDRCAGRLAIPVPDLHSVRAAAGRMDGDRFVPIVRADSDRQR